jgi:hypothetical protein
MPPSGDLVRPVKDQPGKNITITKWKIKAKITGTNRNVDIDLSEKNG